jgi:hypothetical protein
VSAFEVLTAQRSRNVVGVYRLSRERGGHGQRAKPSSALGEVAMDALGALGGEATICATEQRVTAALYAVMADDGLTISV